MSESAAVAGAPLFLFVGLNADTERFRKLAIPTPEEADRQRGSRHNLKFYNGEVVCVPDRMHIDELHARWWRRYSTLEAQHGFIQWLFPIREHGVNPSAFPLSSTEIPPFRRSPAVQRRLLRSYILMLDFYGFVPVPDTSAPPPTPTPPPTTPDDSPVPPAPAAARAAPCGSPLPPALGGAARAASLPPSARRLLEGGVPAWAHDVGVVPWRFQRGEHFGARAAHLASSAHNWLRVTRMLKAAEEYAPAGFAAHIVSLLLPAVFETRELAACERSAVGYWAGVLRSDIERLTADRYVHQHVRRRRLAPEAAAAAAELTWADCAAIAARDIAAAAAGHPPTTTPPGSDADGEGGGGGLDAARRRRGRCGAGGDVGREAECVPADAAPPLPAPTPPPAGQGGDEATPPAEGGGGLLGKRTTTPPRRDSSS